MTRLYPYPTVGRVFELSVTGVRLDGVADPTVGAVDGTLDVSDRSWSIVTLEVEAIGPKRLPGSEHRMTGVLRSPASNARLATSFEQSKLDAGRWTATLEVPRHVVAGPVSLQTVLSGTLEGTPYRYLGESGELVIHADSPAINPITGALPVRWIKFDQEHVDPPILKRYSKEPFYVQVDERQPVVYLNSGFPRLAGVLTDRRLPAAASALRDTMSTGIASQAWMAMFNAAAGDVLGDDDLETFPQGWKGDVLRRLLVLVYELEGEESALRKLREAWEVDRGAGIQSLLVATIETHVGVGRRLRASLEGLKHELVNQTDPADRGEGG
jgi:hypothetical protein